MRLALLLLLAGPAAAQDLPAQFEAARAAFVLPGQSGDVMALDDAVIALLPSLEGAWVPASVLAQDGPLDPATVATACARTPETLSRVSERSFEIRRGAPGHPVLSVRYDYLFGNLFQGGVAEADLLAFLGFPEGMDVPPTIFADAGGRGEAMLFHPSPDILVLASKGRAEILARCP